MKIVQYFLTGHISEKTLFSARLFKEYVELG